MRTTVLTIAAIVIAQVSAFSQSDTETRYIKTTAFQVYETYKVVIAGLYSKSVYTEDNFMALFDSKAVIYNDILPDNSPQQLSPAAYYAKFKVSINRIYPVFSDFVIGEPFSVGNKWQIKCFFTRETRFRTQKEMKYPEWSFNYVMTLEMDKQYNTNKKVYENAKIISIDVKNPLKTFFIIENNENIPLVTKSGETLKNWDEEYQSRIFPEDKWKIYDIKVADDDNIFELAKIKFSKNKTDAHFYQLDVQRFRKNIFGIGVNFSPSPLAFGNKISVEKAENSDSIEYKSNAYSLSFFYGKQIAHKEKSTVFINVGLDFNRYSYEYSETNNIMYRDSAVFDDDRDPYFPIIKINSLKEKINTISVPLSVQYLYQLSQPTKKPIFLSFELGLFAGCTLSSRYNLDANYSGLYEKYFNIIFDHYYDFGKCTVPGDIKLNSRFTGGIFGGVGLWYALNESSLLKFSISYKHAFNSTLEEYKAHYMTLENKQNKIEKYEILKKEDLHQSLLHSTERGMQNIAIGISWVKTIGENKK